MPSEAIEALRRASFDPRTVAVNIPAEALRLVGIEAHAFLESLDERPGLYPATLLGSGWRSDCLSSSIYAGVSREGRLEIHAIMGAVLHEMTHKADLLQSPFGVSYFSTMLTECGSAWNRNPVGGVIGVQTGPH
ncbi:hypothetical protein HVPorG_04711 (plasmid) [Roseomonas mucosa]|nr:hypothetical protein HVPorG_04711 [Roseomonas mucosa]